METPKILLGASRQYKHNTDSDGDEPGFVRDFDGDETIKVVNELILEVKQLRHIRDQQRKTIKALNSSNSSAFSRVVEENKRLRRRADGLNARLNALDAHEQARTEKVKSIHRLRREFAATDPEVMAIFANEVAGQIRNIEAVTATLAGKLETVAKRHDVTKAELEEHIVTTRENLKLRIGKEAAYTQSCISALDNAAIVRFHKTEARMDKAEAAITWGATNDG